MKIKSNVKAGGISRNHNEKMASDIKTVEQKKTLGKKLRLSKETIRELRDSDLKVVAGGRQGTTTVCSGCGGGGCGG